MACYCKTIAFCRINWKLLPIKMFYFTFLAGIGSLIPFIAVYMKQLGLTSNETGVIYGAMPFLSFVVRPLVGSLADRWMKHKVVLIVCTLLTTVLHLLIMFVPPRAVASGVVHVKPAFLHCAWNGSALTSCLADVPGSEAGNPGFEEEGVSPAAGCAASLEKFADEINGSAAKYGDSPADFRHHHHHTVVVIDDDGSGGVDLHDGVAANDSEAGYRSVPPRLAADHYDFCSMACYRSSQDSAGGRSLHVRHHGLTTSEEEEGEEEEEVEEGTSSVCFTHDQVQPASLPTTQQQQQQQQQQRYCDGLRVDDLQPLRFNLTNPLRLFSGQRQGPSPPRRDNRSADFLLLECPSYPLLDVEFSARTYNTVTCPTPLSLACVMLCKGVAVVSLCDGGGYAGAGSLDMTLGLLMVVYFFASAAYAPILSIADAVIFDQLGPDHAHKYGQQRMWGALGVAIFAILSTFAVNTTSDVKKGVSYDVMFYLFTGMCTLSALTATALTFSSRVRCQSVLKSVCRLLTLPEVLAFLVVVMYLGAVSGATQGFLFWYLADLGGGPLLFGFSLVVNCGFEIPFFFFSGAILKRLNPINCLYFAMLVLSLRLLAYSMLSNPWQVLYAEALHGVTFALMWAAVASHANAIAPVGLSASVQGLVGSMNFGIGKGVGSLVTGLLFSSVGARWTFRILAIVCLLLLTAYALLNTYVFTEHTAQQDSLHRSVEQQGTGKTEDEGEMQQEGLLGQRTTDCT